MRMNLFISDKLEFDRKLIDQQINVRSLFELSMESYSTGPCILALTKDEWDDVNPKELSPFRKRGLRLIITDSTQAPAIPTKLATSFHGWLPQIDDDTKAELLVAMIRNAHEQLILIENNRRLTSDLGEMTRIGTALSSEKDNNRLLTLILTRSRQLTNSDAGSIYLVETGEHDERRLRFKYTQNDSVNMLMDEFTLPIDNSSIAGYVAKTGKPLAIKDAYDLGDEYPFQHQRWFDKNNNYRTISILAVPMQNLKGDVVGVLQLINCKRDGNVKLIDPYTAITMVEPFDRRTRALVEALASQAAVSIEKNQLHESIEDLFEGFVKASVTAIESRDPTTSGHSERVALLTVELARHVDKEDAGPFRGIHFSKDDIKEIRYSALLHDFGKVGVREHVLVKAEKFYPWQAQQVKDRERYIKKALEAYLWRKRFELYKEFGPERAQEKILEIEKDHETLKQKLHDHMESIWEANMPKVLEGGQFDKLQDIATFNWLEGVDDIKLLAPEEVSILSIPKGSLTEVERLEIESHVTHTYEFLKNIPWTRELRHVPEIAYGHHERINGTGYPRNLSAPEIPVQSKMMGITDVYDALTATDRPYKKAMSADRALTIIGYEVKDGKLDPDLHRVFVESKAFEVVGKKAS